MSKTDRRKSPAKRILVTIGIMAAVAAAFWGTVKYLEHRDSGYRDDITAGDKSKDTIDDMSEDASGDQPADSSVEPVGDKTDTETNPEIRDDGQSGDNKDIQSDGQDNSSDGNSDAQSGSKPSNSITIAIDPGHQSPGYTLSDKEQQGPGLSSYVNAYNSGASGAYSGKAEYQINLEVSLKLKAALEKEGYNVFITRDTNDISISNKTRAEMCNNSGASAVIRIHCDGAGSSSPSGASVQIPGESLNGSDIVDTSRTFGDCVLRGYCNATGMSNRGLVVRSTAGGNSLVGFNWSSITTVVLEMGFMTNQHDDLYMADSANQDTMVSGIVDGVNEYFGQ